MGPPSNQPMIGYRREHDGMRDRRECSMKCERASRFAHADVSTHVKRHVSLASVERNNPVYGTPETRGSDFIRIFSRLLRSPSGNRISFFTVYFTRDVTTRGKRMTRQRLEIPKKLEKDRRNQSWSFEMTHRRIVEMSS